MVKTVFVTGGAGALGRAVVRQFCNEGYNVAFTYKKSKGKAAELAKETGALALEVDLLEREQVAKAIADTIEKYGQIDILVNNAGRTQIMPFALLEDEDWDGIMASNLKTMFITTQEAVRGMIYRKEGVIVNIGSLAGHRLLEVPVHYAAAKAGVMGFTLSLARELAPFNIRVNSIVPGLLEDGVGRMVPEKELKEYVSYCTAGRPGKMDEVANVVVFTASDKASYMNGQNVFVDGGI